MDAATTLPELILVKVGSCEGTKAETAGTGSVTTVNARIVRTADETDFIREATIVPIT